MKSNTKRITIAALSMTMAVAVASSQIISYAYAPTLAYNSSFRTEEVSATKVTDSVNTSSVVRDNLSADVVDYGEAEEIRNISGGNSTETVIVSLDVPSVLERKSEDVDVAEYLETQEGKLALQSIRDSQNGFLSSLAASGVNYKEVGRYSTVANAVAIEVNLSQFGKIRSLSGVTMAGVSKTYSALADQSAQVNPSNVYGTGIYDSSEYLDRYDGTGVTVAILDTGLDYTHEAFAKVPDGATLGFDRDHVEGKIDELSASVTTPNLTIDDVYLSDKIPFAYDYADKDADVYPSYEQHGTHVAGIIAGQADTYVDKDGHVVGGKGDGIDDFRGVAPNAQLVICKVFTDDLDSEDLGGATSEDIMAALNDCVTLGVDIINMSLGTTSGFSSRDIEGDEEDRLLKEVYTSIKEEGISLISAAGNEYSSGSGSEFGTNLASNPDSGTVGSPSTFVGAMSVASINGQKANYMLGNPDEDSAYGDVPIYYTESNDSNAVPFNFADELLGSAQKQTFRYFVIPGTGSLGDYSSTVLRALKNKGDEKILVLVRRGTLDFQQKVENAHTAGADGIIIYDNVPGTIRMSLGDIEPENRIPAVSINMDAGAKLTADPNNPNRLRTEGKIEINREYTAGPFMNDYSSWGATPDLKLKPDITSHGGEITSTVAGGYEQKSGTSMATPNLAGLMALVKDYLREKNPGIGAKALTTLTNQIVMSSATLVYDEEKLPYSPRKQGAGLATLANIFSTGAYLYTEEGVNGGTEDNRPKIELYEDEQKTGVYSFAFKVKNIDTKPLSFKLVSRFMTETIASDGLAVAEAAHMLTDNPAQFTVSGADKTGDIITVESNTEATVSVTLTLSAAEKNYIDSNFVNGMYVEGFISLVSQTDGQCDLNLPFMGFYGDWEAAPMLDYNAYEIAAIDEDTSLTESEKPHESVFATQLYSTYYNGRYGVPMGSFAYTQDDSDSVKKIYPSEEHCSVSRYNIFTSPTATDNYMTSTGIRSLYAGLLRNAEVVTYDIYNEYTGEHIYSGKDFTVSKAIAGGGSAVPALVDLKLTPDGLGLVNNGKYRMEFNFFRTEADLQKDSVPYANNFTSTFYVDYDAPVLEGSRIRYYDYEENNKAKQRVYLDVDIYDNHYPQAILLCYTDEELVDVEEISEINLATEYVTPIYDANWNGVTTVSIEITDIYEKYSDRLFVQIDDYALNHNVYTINFNNSKVNSAEGGFDFVTNDRVTRKQLTASSGYEYNLTIDTNEMYRVELQSGNTNVSNYLWTTPNSNIVALKNNEIFGLKAGTARISVSGGGTTKTLNVTVTDNKRELPRPSLSFDVIQNSALGIEKPRGSVKVNAGQTFKLSLVADPWYYPFDKLLTSNDLQVEWQSTNERIATVAQDGTVTTNNERGTSSIVARVTLPNGSKVDTVVTLSVQEPFTIANMTLSKYHGSEQVVRIPDDKNVMYIGEEAFEDNDKMEKVIIPKTVTEISARAFLNCTALKEVYFIDITDDDSTPVNDLAKLNLIREDAFEGCSELTTVDLTNVKVITVGARAFAGCEKLEKIRHMEKIGIADVNAFKGCISLLEADITGLHTAASNIFEGCTALNSVKTDQYTMISEGMFYGCTALENVIISNPRVCGGARNILGIGGGAFQNCTSLESVTFGGENAKSGTVFRIDPYAFAGCSDLSQVNFGEYSVSYIGDYAFAGTNLTQFTVPNGNPVFGETVFDGVSVTITWDGGYTSDSDGVYLGKTLVLAPATISAGFTIKSDTEEIAPYAFASSTFDGVDTITVPASVKKIGEGAFAGTGITSIVINADITEIPERAFSESGLTTITIPTGVTSIGASAFRNCRDLVTIDFGSSSLNRIGDYAFAGAAVANVTVPDSVTEMGSYVFMDCESLTEAHLPSLTSLGDYTFVGCYQLETASFGDSATASGNYTFFPGSELQIQSGNLVEVGKDSALTTVDLGGLTTLGDGVFLFCNSLVNIDLKNVTEVGNDTFLNCTVLAQVDKIEQLTKIGDRAFARTGLTSLTLTAAEEIGDQAFYNVSATSLSMPAVKSIGSEAFARISITSLNIPSTLEKYGDGAFVSATSLNTVTVDGSNPLFFAENDVLYRKITDPKNNEISYELCLYPANLVSQPSENYSAHYRVKEGTVSIQGKAFSGIVANRLSTVTLPYSVKTIGISAFYGSPISRFNFESISAPVLISEYWNLGDKVSQVPEAFRSLYYTNFQIEFASHVLGGQISTVTLAYPTNGVGYDNYVYRNYFGPKVLLGELMDDNTRLFNKLVDGFDVDVVKGYMNLEVTDANKLTVNTFSESVKSAHRILNNTTSQTQLEMITEARINKLYSVEEALKPVKSKFGISVSISGVVPAENSAHKSQYKSGETFDKSGLIVVVTYDDYSTETISDSSDIIIDANYRGALHTYDTFVAATYKGVYFRIPITVTAEASEGPDGSGDQQPEEPTGPEEEQGGGCGGCGSMYIGPTIGGTGLLLLTLAGAIILVTRLRRESNKK